MINLRNSDVVRGGLIAGSVRASEVLGNADGSVVELLLK